MKGKNRGNFPGCRRYVIVVFLPVLLVFLSQLGCHVYGGVTDTGVHSLDVRIGQMLLVGFRGLAVDNDHPVIRDIQERHIGGVILFDYDVPAGSPLRNIQSPEHEFLKQALA